MTTRVFLSLATIAAVAVVPRLTLADTAPRALVDRTAVRFYSPETGGADRPRFVSERALAFEARLEVMAQSAQSLGEGYQEHDLRSAMDHDIAEQILVTLAQKLIDESPAASRPDMGELDRVEQSMAQALIERLGGRDRVDAAAAAEQLGQDEVDALLHRGAFAAWYLDRAVTPLLHPTDEQLREVYRTSAHPFHHETFDAAHDALLRWFVVERVRVAEDAYLQAARSHVHVVVTT
jgi:hypothetical protein